MVRAAVLAEGALGTPPGKTANGLVLHAVQDDIVAVIDSTRAGRDAGEVVRGVPQGIPVVADLESALALKPERLYLGVANPGGFLPDSFHGVVLDALRAGLEVVNGLHRFLADEPEFVEAARAGGGSIRDIRKPPTLLRCADGSIFDVKPPRLLVMGQDCDMGKRITALQLLGAARERGVDTAFVATGQTGCMLGPDAGAVIDRIPADFAAGHVEGMVRDVAERGPDLVLVYGQASLFHPAFGGVSLAVLQGCMPQAVVLQVAPGRTTRVLFDDPRYTLATVEEEIRAIEALGRTRVVALALNPTECDDPGAARAELEQRTGLPVEDPLGGDAGRLFDAVWRAITGRGGAPAPGREAPAPAGR